MSWAESGEVGPLERKAFVYTAAMFRGCTVDWGTGRVIPPKE